ncbi:MAG: aminopeptidase P family protein [Deltaproteobacteria bacterium]|jgi:Xaa-Pro aminopeptidase|nr:aminopeptidase P family protein [Deltaproteobacteria bacterium]
MAGPELMNIEDRLSRLRRAMGGAKVEALLISCPNNRRYYSGFSPDDPQLNESSGHLLIAQDRQWLFTDSRFLEQAAEEAPLYEVVEATTLGTGATAKKLLGTGKNLFFEPERMTVAEYARIRREIQPIGFGVCPFDPSYLRVSKEPGELALITKALGITEESIRRLFPVLKGLSEAEAAWALECDFHNLGAEGPAFETIVAAGPRASLPHAVPGAREVLASDLVVVDCGARYQGYASDITRTWAGEDMAPWQKEIYRVVRRAQLAAIAVMAPGMTGFEVDKVARNVIAQAGYGDYFGHGLGHGVGLAVHEAPRLSPKGHFPLPAGAVITVEPGIYIPGKGGVRLEQLVFLTEDGAQVLNQDESFYDF